MVQSYRANGSHTEQCTHFRHAPRNLESEGGAKLPTNNRNCQQILFFSQILSNSLSKEGHSVRKHLVSLAARRITKEDKEN